MVFSDDCWMKSYCHRGLKPEAPCVNSNVFCLKLFKLNHLYDQALVPVVLRKQVALSIDADGTDREEYVFLKQFAADIVDNVASGKNLYIHSRTCGNGKTAWAVRCIQSFFSNIWWQSDMSCRALFISVPRYLLALKNNISSKDDYADHINKNVLSADLVVWDDIATKTATTFEAENLLSMIDSRMNDGKSNIFTSNLDVTDMTQCMGSRLTSRIVNFSTSVEFHGQDKRVLRGM